MRKRCVSVVLATLMVFSLMSTTAFAFENNTIDEPLPSDIEFPSMDIPLMESAGEELEIFLLVVLNWKIWPIYLPQPAQMQLSRNFLATSPQKTNSSMCCSQWNLVRFLTQHWNVLIAPIWTMDYSYARLLRMAI